MTLRRIIAMWFTRPNIRPVGEGTADRQSWGYSLLAASSKTPFKQGRVSTSIACHATAHLSHPQAASMKGTMVASSLLGTPLGSCDVPPIPLKPILPARRLQKRSSGVPLLNTVLHVVGNGFPMGRLRHSMSLQLQSNCLGHPGPELGRQLTFSCFKGSTPPSLLQGRSSLSFNCQSGVRCRPSGLNTPQFPGEIQSFFWVSTFGI